MSSAGAIADGWPRCHYCGAPADDDDHVVPQSIIPRYYALSVPNLVPACYSCNREKGDSRQPWCCCSTCTTAWDAYDRALFVAINVPRKAYRLPGLSTPGSWWCEWCDRFGSDPVHTAGQPLPGRERRCRRGPGGVDLKVRDGARCCPDTDRVRHEGAA